MRRWTFSLLIALSAFGLGSTIAVQFYQRVPPNIQQSNQPLVLSRSYGDFRADLKTYSTPTPSESEDGNDDYKCSGLDNEDFFEPAINRWLKGKKLSTKPMRPPEEYRSDGDEYTASLVDVNQDGRDELMIKAYCSPLENCRFFIYEKQGKDYRQIFFSRTGIQTVSFTETSINHYPKIRVRTKLDEKSGFFLTYELDKTYYDATDCTKYKIDKVGTVSTAPIECYLVDDCEK